MLGLNFLLIWALYVLSRKLAPFSEARAKLMSEANGVLVDSITNASLVKNFSNFLYENAIISAMSAGRRLPIGWKFTFWAFVYRSGGFARADAGGFLRAAGLVLV